MRAVFFDLYGTLFLPPDPAAARRAWIGACRRELAARGVVAGEAEFQEKLLALWKTRPAPAGGTPFEDRIAALARGYGIALAAASLRAIADSVCRCWQAEHPLDPEAPAVLAALAACRRVALVSNFDHPPHVGTVLFQTGLSSFFEKVVVSGDVGVEKPDPGILLLASDGLAPAEIAYVGDSIVDYEAALAAGMRPFLIRRPGQVSGDAPQALKERYGDVEAALVEAERRGALTRIASLRELTALL